MCSLAFFFFYFFLYFFFSQQSGLGIVLVLLSVVCGNSGSVQGGL